MTSVWVAEHGWSYLNAAIDAARARSPAGRWSCWRAQEAVAVIDAAVAERGSRAGELTLGTDNGTAFTSRAFRARLRELGISIAAAATATPRARRSSSPGSQSSSSAASGARSSRRSTRPASDRRLHRRLSPPAPPGAGLPNAARSRGDLERSRRPVNPSGLTDNTDGVHANDWHPVSPAPLGGLGGIVRGLRGHFGSVSGEARFESWRFAGRSGESNLFDRVVAAHASREATRRAMALARRLMLLCR